MTRYGQIGWRTVAVAAFVGTAVLAVALTRAPAHDGVTLSSDVSSRVCATSGLEAWLGLGTVTGETSAAGIHPAGTYYTLEFTNVSDRACSLYGYPEVSAYRDGLVTGGQFARGQLAGNQIGARRSGTPRSGRSRLCSRPERRRTPCCGSSSPSAAGRPAARR